jgi:hypothetical protein
LDTRYERANQDFWQQHIVPALMSSRRLIVISTADAFSPRTDGSPNWVEREIATYFGKFNDPDRIFVALAPGAPEDRYPGRLGDISERWDYVDLRAYRRFYWLFPWRAKALEISFSKLVAGIFDIPAEFMPELREEERRRHNRQRLAIAALLASAIGLSTFGGWQWYERAQGAIEAEANSIWGRMDVGTDYLQPDEINAFWNLATAELPVFKAFWGQLPNNRGYLGRVAKAPKILARTAGLKPSERAKVALRGALESFRRTDDPEVLRALVQVVWSLPSDSASLRASSDADPVIDVFSSTSSPDQFENLARALQALPVKLTERQLEALANAVLRRFRETKDSKEFEALAKTLRALPLKLTSEQISVAAAPMLDVFRRCSASEFSVSARALQVLAVELTPEQADFCISAILKSFRSNPLQVDDRDPIHMAGYGLLSDTDALKQDMDAIEVLAPKLSDEAKTAALSAIVQRLPEVFEEEHSAAMLGMIRALASDLAPERTTSILDHIIEQLSKSTEARQLRSMASALLTLPGTLTPQQAAIAFDAAFTALRKAEKVYELDSSIGAIVALSSKVTREQAAANLAPLESFLETTSVQQVAALARAISVPSQLDSHVPTVLSLLLKHLNAVRLDRVDGSEQLETIDLAISFLARRLLPEQATATMAELIKFAKAHPLERKASLRSMWKLAEELPSERILPVFSFIIERIVGTSDYFQLGDLAVPLIELAPKLTQDQSATGVDAL